MTMSTRTWRASLEVLTARLLHRYRVLPKVLTSALDVPDRLPKHGAVVVRKGDDDQWLAFDCPCPARHRVMVNLDKQSWPVWTIRTGVPLTLVPSVDEKTEHGQCHYVIKKGRIRWV